MDTPDSRIPLLLLLWLASCSLGPDLPNPVAGGGDDTSDTSDTGDTGS